MTKQNYAPGMRVVIRDAEWRIRRADDSGDGGHLLTCDGISQLVRGREGRFLTRLEAAVDILDPVKTKLTEDNSANYQAAQLYIESQLRQRVPADTRVHFGHRAAMDSMPFQLDPTRIALAQPRQRILIADAVGLGKTLEAGILVAELIRRGRGKRILVLAVKSMLAQFQKEFWSRFTIPLTRLDSTGLQKVRNRIPTSHNPFHYFDKTIISIDTLKQDIEYRHYLETAWWDIIVIDEAHNVAERGSNSLRSKLAKLLAKRSDTLIMLSATPHDGKAESFASLVNMLDPTAISNTKDYNYADFADKNLVVRRFKKDVKDQISGEFPPRNIAMLSCAATAAEEEAYRLLADSKFPDDDAPANSAPGTFSPVPGTPGTLSPAPDGIAPIAPAANIAPAAPANIPAPGTPANIAPAANSAAAITTAITPTRDKAHLFRITLAKALFSSPQACASVVTHRLKRLTRSPAAHRQSQINCQSQINELQSLLLALNRIDASQFSKYQLLLETIRQDLNWQANNPGDRLVIFTESIPTLTFLARHLQADLALNDKQIATLRGDQGDTVLMETVEDFGKTQSPLRLLICSDVAAEGINLHHLCHKMIHFDIPWSLMVFQQRNGRIDRYGQRHQPQIRYLLTKTCQPRISDDMRILEILFEKDEQAQKNIGDSSEFTGKYTPEDEEQQVADFMAQDNGASLFEALLNSNAQQNAQNAGQGQGQGLLAGLNHIASPGTSATSTPPADALTETDSSLFASEQAYCKAALSHLSASGQPIQHSIRADNSISLIIPPASRHWFSQLPAEIIPGDWQFCLSEDKAIIADAIARARSEQHPYPDVHYLWQINPVVQWLDDKIQSLFGRHQAPVIRLPHLFTADEDHFIISGLFPNRKSHPMVNPWQVVSFNREQLAGNQTFAEFLTNHPQLADKRELSNSGGKHRNHQRQQDLLAAAIGYARQHFIQQRNAFERHINQQLNAHLQKLETLRQRQLEQLDLDFAASKQLPALLQSRKAQRTREIDENFNVFIQWIEDTMTTEQHPWIQVIAVITGAEG